MPSGFMIRPTAVIAGGLVVFRVVQRKADRRAVKQLAGEPGLDPREGGLKVGFGGEFGHGSERECDGVLDAG